MALKAKYFGCYTEKGKKRRAVINALSCIFNDDVFFKVFRHFTFNSF